MKTLHLTNAWCPISGGVATFYRALLEAANARGRLLRLVVPGAEDRVEEAGSHGKIYHVKAPRAPFNYGYRMILPHQLLFPGSRILRILAEEQPDLVEVCDKYTLNWLAGLLRIHALPGVTKRPVVVGLSCERLDENFRTYIGWNPAAEWFCRFYMHWFYFPFFDHHIAVSDYASGELRAASGGHRVRRGVWIRPMGVHIREMSPSRRTPEGRRQLLRATGGDERTVLLLYAGRLAREKNLPLLMETMGELFHDPEYDYRLVIAGSGGMRKELERQAVHCAPARVAFLGHVAARERLAGLYANADVFVHPNPREPFGIAPLEAMASGLPLVAPPTGGVSAYANAGNCWFAEPGPAAFAAAIRATRADPLQRARRTQAARATAERFDWPSVCSSFLDLYEGLCAAAAGAGPLPQPDFVSTANRATMQGGALDPDHAQAFPGTACRRDRPALGR